MPVSLARARKRPLLQGRRVLITPKKKPGKATVSRLVTAVHGQGQWFYSSELLLNGIVTQKLDYERHQLFEDHVRRTRSPIWLKKATSSSL
ncbi:hypothetical protein GQ457_08G033390 [Hibiscus cannabinus]